MAESAEEKARRLADAKKAQDKLDAEMKEADQKRNSK